MADLNAQESSNFIGMLQSLHMGDSPSAVPVEAKKGPQGANVSTRRCGRGNMREAEEVERKRERERQRTQRTTDGTHANTYTHTHTHTQNGPGHCWHSAWQTASSHLCPTSSGGSHPSRPKDFERRKEGVASQSLAIPLSLSSAPSPSFSLAVSSSFAGIQRRLCEALAASQCVCAREGGRWR